MNVTMDELLGALRRSWGRDTSGPAFESQWSPANPACGQCSVTALIIQDYLGGEVKRFAVVDNGVDMKHVANVLPDGTLLDATASQFTAIPVYVPRTDESREDALAWGNTAERYAILRDRVARELRGDLP